LKSIWLLPGVVFWSCVPASVETTPLNVAPRPLAARPARSVEIFASSPPTRPHVDVALLRADGGSIGDTQAMVQSLTERAAELGCDALFFSGAGERPGAPGDLYLFDPGSHQLYGTCVVYLSDAAPSPGSTASPTPTNNGVVLLPPKEAKANTPAVVRSGTSSQR